MPIYDFQCQDCYNVEEHIAGVEERQRLCVKCGGTMNRLISAAPYHKFKEGYWEHLDAEPIYIKSKRQLKEECVKRGFHSDYAWD